MNKVSRYPGCPAALHPYLSATCIHLPVHASVVSISMCTSRDLCPCHLHDFHAPVSSQAANILFAHPSRIPHAVLQSPQAGAQGRPWSLSGHTPFPAVSQPDPEKSKSLPYSFFLRGAFRTQGTHHKSLNAGSQVERVSDLRGSSVHLLQLCLWCSAAEPPAGESKPLRSGGGGAGAGERKRK